MYDIHPQKDAILQALFLMRNNVLVCFVWIQHYISKALRLYITVLLRKFKKTYQIEVKKPCRTNYSCCLFNHEIRKQKTKKITRLCHVVIMYGTDFFASKPLVAMLKSSVTTSNFLCIFFPRCKRDLVYLWGNNIFLFCVAMAGCCSPKMGPKNFEVTS